MDLFQFQNKMTNIFFKNLYLGSELSDDEMADVPYPKFELYYHVIFKTVQAGSILGMCVFGPVIGLVRGRSLTAIKSAAMRGGRIGAGIGVLAGPVMTETMLSQSKATPDSIYDRSYRIRYNIGQVRTDRFATYGAVLGLGAASLMGAPAINGGIVGFTAATFFAGFYNMSVTDGEPKKAPRRIIKEKK